MAEPALHILKDGKISKDKLPVSVGASNRFGITYLITPNGNKKLRIVFPVFSEKDTGDGALLYKEDWDPGMITFIPPSSGVRILPPPIDEKGDCLAGICDISIDTGIDTDIYLKLCPADENALTPLNFNAPSPVATCNIFVFDNSSGIAKWTQKASAHLIIADNIKPGIIKFTANKIFAAPNENIKLDWQVANANSVTIKVAGENEPLWISGEHSGTYIYEGLSATTKFQLTANKGKVHESSAVITVTVLLNNTTGVIRNLFHNQKIMGIYNYKDEKLYALILETINEKKESIPPVISIWESFDGAKWSRNSISFTCNNGEGDTINIPFDFAGSPGVIFNDKLYLIGGSRYDIDFKSNEVYCYDFNNGLCWQKITAAGPAPSPRMGHSCIVYKEQIWVIGGFTDEGAVDEVWIFDTIGWSKHDNKLNKSCCMGTAIVGKDGTLQYFGGFSDMPGNADKTIKDSLFLEIAEEPAAWKNIPFTAESKVYYNCMAAVWYNAEGDKEQFIFSNCKDISGAFINEVWKTNINGTDFNVLPNNTAYGLDDYWYNIQAVTFKEVIWLCGLQKNDSSTANESLHYFVYIRN